jgi:nitroreductase
METMKAILTRQSIRKYTDKEVSDEIIHKLLEAAMAAPSAKNQRPWQFIVVKDKKILRDLSEVQKYGEMLKEAFCAILVCGDLRLEAAFPGYWVQGCSAATQNILLAAHDLGVGAVWTGVYPREEKVKIFQKTFGMPEQVIPLNFVSLGYPAEKKEKEDRFLQERVHWDLW